jgi:hypothetical protein
MDYALMGWTKMGWAVTVSWAAKGYGLGRDMSSALGWIGIGWDEMGWAEVGYTRYRSSCMPLIYQSKHKICAH